MTTNGPEREWHTDFDNGENDDIGNRPWDNKPLTERERNGPLEAEDSAHSDEHKV